MTIEPNAAGAGTGLEPDVAGPQAESAVTSRPTPPSAPPIFDLAQRDLLKSVLNRIVPGRRGLPGADDLPGAGDLDVGASVERTLATSPRLRRLFLDGLRAIEIEAVRLTGSEFVDLDAARQVGVLEAIEHQTPAFFAALIDHTYRGYYTLPAVQRTIGFEARPPQPLGHELPAFDPAMLDRQRERAPFWRQAH